MRFFGLGLLTLFLAGCALPIPFQIASLAATGISYATTGKSMSDQVLSAVASRDCALHRVALGEDVCLPNALDDSDIMVASGGPMVDTELDGAEDDMSPAMRLRESMIVLAESLDDDLMPADGAIEASVQDNSEQLDTAMLAMAETLNDIAPASRPDNGPELALGDGKHYLVIGRFRQLKDAEQAQGKYAALRTAVRMILREGALLYQVTAGPFSRPKATELSASMTKNGAPGPKVALLCADLASAPPCAEDGTAALLTVQRKSESVQ